MAPNPLTPKTLRVGIAGAGLGGLLAAISISRAGAEVTVLEAASALGEIGAGIQMTPNVSRFLVRYGVDEIIGNNLVQADAIQTWGDDGKLVGWTDLKRVVREYGFPWWVVRRDHLHSGLAEAARRAGANLVIDARVVKLDYETSDPVTVTTAKGDTYTFDLLIGSDGLKSVVRTTLFPDFKPHPPTTNAAYRGVMSYRDVYAKIPEARHLLKNNIDVWVSDNSYAIGYPISGGREYNVVLSHHRARPVTDVEDVDMAELRAEFAHYPPLVRRLTEIMPETKRWPLMLSELASWSSPRRNVVLMGDAAHSMVNHMAQGAATAMEDGAFLGTVVGEVLRGTITVPTAVDLYEKQRQPRAWTKQQGSYTMGALLMYAGTRGAERNRSSAIEVQRLRDNPHRPLPRPPNYRSWILWANPESLKHMHTYDAEGDADMAVCRYLQETTERDKQTGMAKGIEDKWWGYIRPEMFAGLVEADAVNGDANGAVADDEGMWRWAVRKKDHDGQVAK